MKINLNKVTIAFFCILVSNAYSQSTSWTTAGTYSWTVPAGVTKATVKVWGAGGGGGGSNNNSNSGGGGGGGAYTAQTLTNLVPSTVYTNKIIVGTGGVGGTGNPLVAATAGGQSRAELTSTVSANGGGAAGNGSGAGVGARGVGATGGTFNGGDGGTGRSGGVGGGGSAGTESNGPVAPTGTVGATGVTGGGSGGNGTTGNALPGGNPGGGGGGGDRSGGTYGNGGAGGSGKIIIEYYPEITLGDNAQTPSANTCENATNVRLHGFTLAGLNNGGTITSVSFLTSGTYLTSDISNFKLYYTTNSTFATTNLLGTLSGANIKSAGTNMTFTGLTQSVTNTPTLYFWITMDVAASVTDGGTISVNTTSTTQLTTSTANLIFNGSATASGSTTLRTVPTANAGNNVLTCSTSGAVNITDGSSASGYTSVEWSSSGTGTFANQNSLTLCTYDPSPADISAGSVTLTLTANGACTNVTSNKTLTITAGAISVSAGPAIAAICQGGTTEALGGTYGGSATSAIWDDGGAGGSFTNNGGTTPGAATYTASATAPATVTLTLTATAPCGTDSDSKNLTVTPTVGTPVFDLGATSNRCYGGGTQTYTATASDNTGITYSLDATSVAAGNSINPATGEVTFTVSWVGTSIITATATGCNGPKTANHTVTVLEKVSTPAFINVY